MSTTDRDIAQLIGLAGARPPLPAERGRRIRAAVVPAWLDAARSKRRRLRGALVLSLAATLALVVGLGFWLRGPSAGERLATAVRIQGPTAEVISPDGTSAPLTEGETIRAGQTVVSGAGRLALRLESGASLRIDASTEVHLHSSDLLELERGAVYLDSGGDLGASDLSVRTALGTVHEIGTRFEVRLGGDGLRVRVRGGEVRLESPGSSVRGEATDELWLGNDGALRRRTVSAHGAEWDWALDVAPPLELDGRSLGSFLEWVGRETGWSIHFADEASRAEVESTVIRGHSHSTSPSQALPLVLAACELDSRLEDGVLTIINLTETGGKE